MIVSRRRSLLNRYRLIHFAVGVLALIVVAMMPSPQASAQFSGRFMESSHRVFRGILATAGLNPITEVNNLSEPELADVLMIVYGSPVPEADVPPKSAMAAARRILSHGGALLIISEDPGPLDGYFPRPTGLSIASGRVFETRPELCLDQYPGCPYPTARPAPDLELESLLKLAPRTATNHPGLLTLTEPSRYASQVVVGFPATCRYGLPPQTIAANQGLIVAGKGKDQNNPYRVLVVSDTSMFMNQLLAISDPQAAAPQNLTFAYEAVRWLQGPRTRTYCYFLDEGRVQERIFPLRSEFMDPIPPLPPLPNPLDPELQARVADGLNTAAAKFEDENGFNRPILGGDNSRKRFYDILRVVAIMTLVLVLLTGLYRTWTLRHEADLISPPNNITASSLPVDGAMSRLSIEQLRVVRELFLAQGIQIPEKRSKLPPIEITGRKSTGLTKDIRYLWSAMYGDSSSRSALPAKEVETMIQKVWTAAQAGQWRFRRTVGENV